MGVNKMQKLIENILQWFSDLRTSINQVIFEIRAKGVKNDNKTDKKVNDSDVNNTSSEPWSINNENGNDVQTPKSGNVVYGGFKDRFMALCIDLFLIVVTFVVILYLFFQFIDQFNIQVQSDLEIPLIFSVGIPFVFLISMYFVLFECSNLQSTLGKNIFDLKITDDKFDKISFSSSLLRLFGKIITLFIFTLTIFQIITMVVEFGIILTTNRYYGLYTEDLHLIEDEQLRAWFFLITFTISLVLLAKVTFSTKKKGFHDNLAGTVVLINHKSVNISKNTALDPKYAGFWKRFVAFIVDILILMFFCAGVIQIFTPIMRTLLEIAGTNSQDIVVIIFLTIVLQNFVVIFLYYTVFVSSGLQGTLGKYVLGLKITDDNGGKISFFRAMVRFFVSVFSLVLFLIGCLMVLWTKNKQTLHDKVVGTYVKIDR